MSYCVHIYFTATCLSGQLDLHSRFSLSLREESTGSAPQFQNQRHASVNQMPLCANQNWRSVLIAFSTKVKLTCAILFLKSFSGQAASCLPSKHSPLLRVTSSSQVSQSSYRGPPQLRQLRWQGSHSWLSLSTKKPSSQWSAHSPPGQTKKYHYFLCTPSKIIYIFFNERYIFASLKPTSGGFPLMHLKDIERYHLKTMLTQWNYSFW